MSPHSIPEELHRNFDPELNLVSTIYKSVGYHSQFPSGKLAHPTRASMDYALHLLETKDKNYEKRALRIIEKIVSLQDTEPTSKTYGLWSWLYEEPLEQMAPPDWNWADFIGATMAHAVYNFGDRLPEALLSKTKESLAHAAWSIFRRNVGPEYTNIAIMGSAVTATAGELLNEPRLLDYASHRFKRFMEYTKEQGGLNEYNSPTYTLVALHESERILELVQDSKIRKLAEELRHFIWEKLAETYHPETGQLAGPHSRAYSDTLSKGVVSYLKAAVSGEKIGRITDFVIPLPCPEKYKHCFHELPEKEIVLSNNFSKNAEEPEKSFAGTTWLTKEVCLGTVNHECFWTQRRPLIAYWNDSTGEPAVLRLRFLRDGKDFSSFGLHNAQDKNKVLTGISTYTDRGDYHIHLDRTKDGTFTFSNICLRYELTANDAEVKELPGGQYELSSAKWRAVITPAEGEFNDNKVSWKIGKEGNTVFADAVFYEGDETQILFDESVHTSFVSTLEILEIDKESAMETPVFTEADGRLQASWKGLELNYKPFGEKY